MKRVASCMMLQLITFPFSCWMQTTDLLIWSFAGPIIVAGLVRNLMIFNEFLMKLIQLLLSTIISCVPQAMNNEISHKQNI